MTHDSADEDAFKFYENNYVLTFFCIKNGLYYHDTSNWKINLFNIVSETIIGFSETRIKKPKRERDIYAIFCYPTVKYLIKVIIINMPMKCPVTVEDIKFSETNWTWYSWYKGRNSNNKTNSIQYKSHKSIQNSFITASFNHISNWNIICEKKLKLSRQKKFGTVEDMTDRKNRIFGDALVMLWYFITIEDSKLKLSHRIQNLVLTKMKSERSLK